MKWPLFWAKIFQCIERVFVCRSLTTLVLRQFPTVGRPTQVSDTLNPSKNQEVLLSSGYIPTRTGLSLGRFSWMTTVNLTLVRSIQIVSGSFCLRLKDYALYRVNVYPPSILRFLVTLGMLQISFFTYASSIFFDIHNYTLLQISCDNFCVHRLIIYGCSKINVYSFFRYTICTCKYVYIYVSFNVNLMYSVHFFRKWRPLPPS